MCAVNNILGTIRLMGMKRLLLLFSLVPLLLFGDGFDRTYGEWGAILHRYTCEGLVCYQELRCDLDSLENFLCEARGVRWDDFCRWGEEEQAAFLINVYNAQAAYMVACAYPIWSIRRLEIFFDTIFDRRVVCLFGRWMSLNEIEWLTFRLYRDVRIYFALSPATLGGAALRCEPYVGARLDEQLEDQTAQFMANRVKNYLEGCVCSVYVSPIFFWRRCSFECEYGSIWAFIRPYFRENWSTDPFPPCWQLRTSRYAWRINDLCSCLGRAYAGENEEYDFRMAPVCNSCD